MLDAGTVAAFWRNVDVGPPGACWEWKGRRSSAGYGMLYDGHAKDETRAHRLSQEIHGGPIPSGLHVLHSCDNPPCVNPAHLRTGTHHENMQDMRARRRGRPNPKLTPEIRSAILAAPGESTADLAARFGVGMSTVSAVRVAARGAEKWGKK